MKLFLSLSFSVVIKFYGEGCIYSSPADIAKAELLQLTDVYEVDLIGIPIKTFFSRCLNTFTFFYFAFSLSLIQRTSNNFNIFCAFSISLQILPGAIRSRTFHIVRHYQAVSEFTREIMLTLNGLLFCWHTRFFLVVCFESEPKPSRKKIRT